MTGKNLKNGDVFVVSPNNGEQTRIFKKSDGGFGVVVRSNCNNSLEIQNITAWPGVSEELSNLNDREVIVIGLSPNAQPYFGK